MSELSAIERAKKPNTIDSLIGDLKGLGLMAGDTVIVHASMSNIGWVCGEQVAVIEALLSVVGESGTIVMPAHTGNNSDPKLWEHPPVPADWVDIIRENMPAFDKRLTPSRGMGKIAETFQTWPETKRSDHPHVSFTANGRLAERITERHVLSPFFGMDTPLGELYRLDARILLLGVDYFRCTAFHLAEALSEKPKMVKMGCAMRENGQRVWKWFEDFDYDSDSFQTIGEAYDKTGRVTFGKVGCADCRLFEIKPAVDFARDWMVKHD